MDQRIKTQRKELSIWKDSWVWKMAWLDARNNFSRLFLFVSSIIIGIAALVAINSLHINLQADIDDQAKELLGADLVAEANNPFEEELIVLFDSLPYVQSREATFASMVYFPHSKQTRLIRVIALEKKFPFYGEVVTSPVDRYDSIFNAPYTLLDKSLASEYNVSEGDTVKVGKMSFIMAGEMEKFPGTSSISTEFTPSIYISYDMLDSTGLIQFGSRVNYNRYFKTSTVEETTSLIQTVRPPLRKLGHGLDDVEERKENLGEGLVNLYKFFNLMAFVALILGCIGIASSVHIYTREKRQSVAILRCLGASGKQAFYIFLIQTFMVGMLGSVIGIGIGIAIQFGLPSLLSEFFPLEVNVFLSWFSIAEGLILGVAISVLFAILPLLSVQNVPPLNALRIDFKEGTELSRTKMGVGLLVLVFPLLFATYQTEDILTGLSFFGGLILAFICLYFVGKMILYSVRKYFPTRASFIWRQGFSNLYRPNNQTIVLVVVIGLGAFLIATMHIVQTSLLNQVEFVGQENQSNTILFDIQKTQKEGVAKLAVDNGLEVQQLVPIVTCRIQSINDSTVKQIQQDTTDAIPNWAITREYRVTYRDSIHPSEEILEGGIHRVIKGESDKPDSILVTISQGMQENLMLELGDKIVFDVQGFPITTYLGGIREVDWPQDPPNFIFVFPNGVLEEAPQIFVMTTRIKAQSVADKFSRELVALFPNVSLIDLRLILKTIKDFFDKVSFIIRFMALFSIITGLIVLAGAVINSKYARLRENVLLRTLGASGKQIVGITLIEYGYLGLISGFAGILLSLVSGWTLSLFVFEVVFFPEIEGLLLIWFMVTLLTIFIGWLNTRTVLNNSPLEVLRKEA